MIIAIPVGSLMTWQQEIKVFPRLAKLALWYTAKTPQDTRYSYMRKLLRSNECIVIISVTMLEGFIRQINHETKKNPTFKLELQWFMLDEAQMIKQAPTKRKGRRSQYVQTLSKWSQHSVMISGTFTFLLDHRKSNICCVRFYV